MKIALPYKSARFVPANNISKTRMLILLSLVCFGSYLRAGTHPLRKHNGGAAAKFENNPMAGKNKKSKPGFTGPTISYTTPQTVYTGTQASIVPSSSGVAAPAYGTTLIPVGGSAFSRPRGLASDVEG